MGKGRYKVCNWKLYNQGLRQRGALTVWISQAVLEQWRYQGQQKRGGKRLYSDLAIEVCLMVHRVYHLALRQSTGFIQSFFEQVGLSLPIPHYTTLCRRSQSLSIELKAPKCSGALDIVVDATGLKVYGEGEWKVRKFGWRAHRTWMKLHVALNPQDQLVRAVAFTTNAVDDAAKTEELLEAIKGPLHSFTADAAYDKEKVRAYLHQRALSQGEDILVLTALQRNAVEGDAEQRPYLRQRNEDIRVIRRWGEKHWKHWSNYHQRSLAETFMFRYKKILGDHLWAKSFQNQQTEVRLGCKILNQMLELAKPISKKVA